MKVIVTATETIQGATIERYIDTICVNSVVGTNAFSDIGASFTDFFGGYSSSYQNKLGEIYERAKNALINKAVSYGANAIVGFRIDFDEISGQGKSMFMIAASGTAVKIKYDIKDDTNEVQYDDYHDKVYAFDVMNKLEKKISRGEYIISDDDKSWLSSASPCKELVPVMIKMYCNAGNDDTGKYALSYMSCMGYDELCSLVYKEYEENTNARYIIAEHKLFNSKRILDIAKRDMNKALNLFKCFGQTYTNDDYVNMKEILSIIDNAPEIGSLEVVKGGFMSKDKEKYICVCGAKNDPDMKYCESCGRNKKGFTYKEEDIIETFRFRVETLKKCLDE